MAATCAISIQTTYSRASLEETYDSQDEYGAIFGDSWLLCFRGGVRSGATFLTDVTIALRRHHGTSAAVPGGRWTSRRDHLYEMDNHVPTHDGLHQRRCYWHLRRANSQPDPIRQPRHSRAGSSL